MNSHIKKEERTKKSFERDQVRRTDQETGIQSEKETNKVNLCVGHFFFSSETLTCCFKASSFSAASLVRIERNLSKYNHNTKNKTQTDTLCSFSM